MATTKRELTDTRVQGRPDSLDRLTRLAAEIAQRAGLLDDDVIDLREPRDAGADRKIGRRSA